MSFFDFFDHTYIFSYPFLPHMFMLYFALVSRKHELRLLITCDCFSFFRSYENVVCVVDCCEADQKKKNA